MLKKTILAVIFAINIFALNQAIAQNTDKYDENEFEAFESLNKSDQIEIYDPYEKLNRKIYAFNDFIDRNTIEPVARGYRGYIPKPVRKSIHNFVTNINLPIAAINSFIQGKYSNGLATASNFLINTTLGIGGLFDVAGEKKIRYEYEDFGQTLGHYGVKEGPYLILPFWGPSNGRDLTGFAINATIDPMSFNQLKIGGSTDAVSADARIANTLLYGLDLRESLLNPIADLRKDSFDVYAAIRSIYLQKRNSDIKR